MGRGSHFPQLQAPAAHPQSAQVQPSVPQPGILVYMFGRKGLGKRKSYCSLYVSCVADFVVGREKGSKKRGTKTESGVFYLSAHPPTRRRRGPHKPRKRLPRGGRSGRTILWFTLARVYIGPGRLRFLAG